MRNSLWFITAGMLGTFAIFCMSVRIFLTQKSFKSNLVQRSFSGNLNSLTGTNSEIQKEQTILHKTAWKYLEKIK